MGRVIAPTVPIAGILTAALLPSLALSVGWRNAAAAVVAVLTAVRAGHAAMAPDLG